MVKKANLAGHFHVNLAFFRHVQTSTAVQFDLDFATIKQSRAKRSVTFSLPTGNELPEKLPKLYGSKSGQKSICAKSSAIPSTSVDTSQNIEGPSADIPLVSEGAISADIPSEEEQASTSERVKLAPDVSVSEDFQFEGPQATESITNVSDNTASNLVITNVRSVGVMSLSEVSRSGGLSAEDMPPLELNKHLHVSIECYPNLLKHSKRGKLELRNHLTKMLGSQPSKVKRFRQKYSQNFTLITLHVSDLRSQFQAPWERQLVMSWDPAHLHQMQVITQKMMRIMFQIPLTWVGTQMVWK